MEIQRFPLRDPNPFPNMHLTTLSFLWAIESPPLKVVMFSIFYYSQREAKETNYGYSNRT
jgi:hypothetical protein